MYELTLTEFEDPASRSGHGIPGYSMYIHDEYYVYLGLLDTYVRDIFRSDYQPSPMASSWFMYTNVKHCS